MPQPNNGSNQQGNHGSHSFFEEHVAPHAAGEAAGYALGGSAGAEIGGFAACLLHTSSVNEGEREYLNQQAQRDLNNFHKKR